MKKAIVLKPDDKIEIVDFDEKNSYQFFQNAVKAENEDLNSTFIGFIKTDAELPFGDSSKMSFCYNDNFLVNSFDDFEKINALSTFILETEMRGNVVVTLVDEEGQTKGFEKEDAEIFLKAIENFKKQFTNEISQLHGEYDNNKGEPCFEIKESFK